MRMNQAHILGVKSPQRNTPMARITDAHQGAIRAAIEAGDYRRFSCPPWVVMITNYAIIAMKATWQ